MAEIYQPNKKVGKTEDIAETLVKVLIDMPDYLNGCHITLDGGATIQDQFTIMNKYRLLSQETEV